MSAFRLSRLGFAANILLMGVTAALASWPNTRQGIKSGLLCAVVRDAEYAHQRRHRSLRFGAHLRQDPSSASLIRGLRTTEKLDHRRNRLATRPCQSLGRGSANLRVGITQGWDDHFRIDSGAVGEDGRESFYGLPTDQRTLIVKRFSQKLDLRLQLRRFALTALEPLSGLISHVMLGPSSDTYKRCAASQSPPASRSRARVKVR